MSTKERLEKKLRMKLITPTEQEILSAVKDSLEHWEKNVEGLDEIKRIGVTDFITENQAIYRKDGSSKKVFSWSGGDCGLCKLYRKFFDENAPVRIFVEDVRLGQYYCNKICSLKNCHKDGASWKFINILLSSRDISKCSNDELKALRKKSQDLVKRLKRIKNKKEEK